uniref:Uncharacterized protein n=1 Tax=Cacopsylla melanoneura TaxID=428564 RepID=A0A8D8SCJ1_9HEMI
MCDHRGDAGSIPSHGNFLLLLFFFLWQSEGFAWNFEFLLPRLRFKRHIYQDKPISCNRDVGTLQKYEICGSEFLSFFFPFIIVILTQLLQGCRNLGSYLPT